MSSLPFGATQLGDAIREAVPEWALPLFVAVTHLGSAAAFLTVFALDYWFGDSRRGARSLALLFGGMALVVALKTAFAQPRPDEALRAVAATGYSFPSGHATVATIGFGLLALDVDRWRLRWRVAAAAALVALVALSRVVLGVHFLRDVVAGVAVGAAYLAVVRLLADGRPRTGFRVAAAVGLVAVVRSGASHHGAAVFGVTAGAVATWEALGAVPTVETRRHQVALGGVGVPTLGSLGLVGAYVVESPVAVAALAAVLTAALLAAPLAVRRAARAPVFGASRG